MRRSILIYQVWICLIATLAGESKRVLSIFLSMRNLLFSYLTRWFGVHTNPLSRLVVHYAKKWENGKLFWPDGSSLFLQQLDVHMEFLVGHFIDLGKNILATHDRLAIRDLSSWTSSSPSNDLGRVMAIKFLFWPNAVRKGAVEDFSSGAFFSP